MKQRILFLVSVVSVAACAQHTASRQSAKANSSFSAVSATRSIVFERNSGQAPAEYAAIARTPQLDAAFHAAGVSVGVKDRAGYTSATVALGFRGGSRVTPIEEAPLPGRVHYLRGADARQWTTDVPTFGRLRYKNVYPGIDVVFYGTDRQLEYDFVVAPHADPAAIALTFSGADSVRAGAGGDLVVSAAGRDMIQKLPAAYQDRGGRRVPVAASYAIASDGAVTFELGDYDRSSPLTIDPMIVLSRFLGGSDADISKRVVARNGFVYIAGETCSTDFPTQSAFQRALGGQCDAFISKFTGDGTQLVSSTYLGGSSTDYANGLAVDAAGAIYVAGYTASTDFPTTPGAFQRTCGGDGSCLLNGSSAGDGWVAKIASSGSSLVYGTYVGGGGTDFFNALAVNAAGEAVVTGESAGTDYPTTPGAPQRSKNGVRDAVITKLSADGSSLAYSTYFGGSGLTESGLDVAYDASGNAWAVGQTDSSNFPVMGAFQPSLGNTPGSQVTDGFVVELTAAGSLAFSSYYGGDGIDLLFGVAPDASGIYVIGYSRSALVPGQASARDVTSKGQAAVVAQIATNGSHVIKAQLVDGSGSETGSHLIVTHPSGSTTLVHAVGWTGSTDFPFTAGAWQKAPASNPSGPFDIFYATLPLDSGGTLAPPSFATYLGGSGTELFPDLSSDGSDGVFLLTAVDNSFPRINAAPGTKSTDAVLVHVVPEARWTESAAGEVHLYAADATATGSEWSLVADPTAADGRRAANVDRGAPKVTTPLAAPSSFVEWTFDADPGAYRIWIRGIAAANSFNNDSVYVQFSDSVDTSGNPIWRIDTTSATPVVLEDCTGCGVHGWGWNDNGYGAGVLGPLVRFDATSSGHHVMRIQAREDGLSIDQVVLSKAQYMSAAPGATKDDATVLKRTSAVTPPPPPPPPGDCTAGEVVVYPGVHSTIVGGASTWHTVADTTAAANVRVFYPDAGAAKAAAPSAAPSSFFTVSFTADANVDYHIWLRGKAQDNFWGNDSAWLQFNDAIDASGGAIWRTGTTSGTSVNLEDCSGCGESEWGWQDNGYPTGVRGQAVRFPTSGTHSMLVQIREDGYSIDQIVLSSGKYVSAAPGALKNDGTKLPECQAPPLR